MTSDASSRSSESESPDINFANRADVIAAPE